MEEKTYGNKRSATFICHDTVNEVMGDYQARGDAALAKAEELNGRTFFYTCFAREITTGEPSTNCGFLTVKDLENGTPKKQLGEYLFAAMAESGMVLMGYTIVEYSGGQIAHAKAKAVRLDDLPHVDPDNLPEGFQAVNASMPNSKPNQDAEDAMSRAMEKLMRKKPMGNA